MKPGGLRRPPRLARVLVVIGWNVFILLALSAGVEIYLRLTTPFRENVQPLRTVPGVGIVLRPRAEVRHTNMYDFWQVSRTNSFGFLDREPPTAGRAAASCHVTLIGDSYVDARQVPIVDKAQARLEELAAREAPGLNVTTSAFGYDGTGTINQLPFYDVYARRLSPDVVVLVMSRNDLWNNSLALESMRSGFNPDWPPHLAARWGASGEIEFVPPASSLEELRATRLSRAPKSPRTRIFRRVREWSFFADRLWGTVSGRVVALTDEILTHSDRLAWAALISQHPRHAALTRRWTVEPYRSVDGPFLAEDQLPIVREALDVTRFGLEQFRERAESDGSTLVILAGYPQWRDGKWFRLLSELAAGIPVISQYEHIVAAGGPVEDAYWAHDYHWSPAGHRWAAEAILEWLKRNPRVCNRGAARHPPLKGNGAGPLSSSLGDR